MAAHATAGERKIHDRVGSTSFRRGTPCWGGEDQRLTWIDRKVGSRAIVPRVGSLRNVAALRVLRSADRVAGGGIHDLDKSRISRRKK